MCSSVIPYIPEEIITNILLKLTPKVLLRFKCVSQSWNQVISSPDFVNAHMKQVAKDKEFIHHRVLFQDSKNNFKICYLPCAFHKGKWGEVIDIDSPINKPLFWMVGSANGLICYFFGYEEGLLWNPTIGKSKRLPEHELKVRSYGTYFIRYGFGYDELHDDYIVVLVYYIPKNDGTYKNLVRIYSLKMDSWRTVNGCRGYFSYCYSSKFLNGKIYWPSCSLAFDVYWGGYQSIISLDLTNEKWEELPLPSNGRDKKVHLELGVVGSDLSVLYTNPSGTASHVWILKDCKGYFSWIKMFTIEYPQDVRSYMKYVFISTVPSLYTDVCLWNRGEFLLLLPPFIMMYNPKVDDSIRQLKLTGFTGSRYAEIYVETLVDPLLLAGRGRHN